MHKANEGFLYVLNKIFPSLLDKQKTQESIMKENHKPRYYFAFFAMKITWYQNYYFSFKEAARETAKKATKIAKEKALPAYASASCENS